MESNLFESSGSKPIPQPILEGISEDGQESVDPKVKELAKRIENRSKGLDEIEELVKDDEGPIAIGKPVSIFRVFSKTKMTIDPGWTVQKYELNENDQAVAILSKVTGGKQEMREVEVGELKEINTSTNIPGKMN
ncbi:MAG: hypothetical protein A2648_00580 [Candidatus Lloydbacteria bacterium RIFCSPHIGHO2_01_FULL_41_20]|uniref:Uncharacterized protein n=1 Tax=Candidatus Lloydbacteria bacterium RIFCSPHIGHO2_01_FULL_41_20 TaxID=1798657 RepID=A0A1G2CTW2_9BACT|nr:MAG: hypothetical protein A2648_00580 [Candidatus Lloydbacteria bacterium RIFCSPHIGHO2_01_FULL_41_20]